MAERVDGESVGRSLTISVVIPSIPPRGRMLMRALASVAGQTRQPDQIVVSIDNDGIGSAANRNRALESATGEWTAFLDDDDEFLPHHLERLMACVENLDLPQHPALGVHDNPVPWRKPQPDLVYPWFEGINQDGIFTVPVQSYAPETYCQIVQADPFGRCFDDRLRDTILNDGNFIPVTVLVRTDLLRKVGGFQPLGADSSDQCDDWGAWQALLKAGAKFEHLPERTWRWNGHPNHTSGRKWTEVYK